jgi:CBS-domain-containing membrane protein
MTPHFETAESSEMAEGAFRRLQSSPCPALPVLQGDRLVGVLTLDNIGEFLTLQSALRSNGKGGAPGRRGA